jgi:transposase
MNKLDKIKSIKKTKPAVYKAIELKINNPSMNNKEIAKIVGRDASSVYRALKNYGIDTKKVNTYKKLRADILAGTQGRIIENITEEDLTKAGLRDKAIAFGVFFDKERLERNQSTANYSLASVVERADKKFRMENGSNEYIPNAYNKEKGIDANKWNKEQAAIKDTIIENNASQDASDSV